MSKNQSLLQRTIPTTAACNSGPTRDINNSLSFGLMQVRQLGNSNRNLAVRVVRMHARYLFNRTLHGHPALYRYLAHNHNSLAEATCTAGPCYLGSSLRASSISYISRQLCLRIKVILSTAAGALSRTGAYSPLMRQESAVNGHWSGETDIRDKLFSHVHSIACNEGQHRQRRS